MRNTGIAPTKIPIRPYPITPEFGKNMPFPRLPPHSTTLHMTMKNILAN